MTESIHRELIAESSTDPLFQTLVLLSQGIAKLAQGIQNLENQNRELKAELIQHQIHSNKCHKATLDTLRDLRAETDALDQRLTRQEKGYE